ncbi:hypothetical protein SANA_11460 [Gottschalkiaceae bacterium SANA]|nr:hypothetical protein SANA_11460 [Gottschalkiaceae bacterium SANA]
MRGQNQINTTLTKLPLCLLAISGISAFYGTGASKIRYES